MTVVSVIVPVYKVEKYIKRCVDSILAQTFKEFEIILVDDGSPDLCGVICDEYAKNNSFINVVHKENGGLSSARNAGIRAAKGEYLFFVDSDDVLHPNALRLLYDKLISTKSQIAIGSFTRFYEDSKIVFEDTFELETNIFSSEQIIKRLYSRGGNAAQYVSVCGKLFHKELFKDISFPVGKLFEDEYVTYLLYYNAEKLAVTNKVIYFYFVNTQGITGNLTLEKRLDQYDSKWLRICFFKENDFYNLFHIALLDYLKAAQWDLIEYRKNKIQYDYIKGRGFEQQYQDVFNLAIKQKILSFMKDYDFFVLANPKYTFFYRMKRFVLKHFEK